MDWGSFKLWLGEVLGITADGLHVHVGLLLLFLTAWVMRRPPWTWPPVIVVIVIETINEIYDMTHEIRLARESGLFDSIHDFILTLLWPIVIVALFPVFRRFERAKTIDNPVTETASSAK